MYRTTMTAISVGDRGPLTIRDGIVDVSPLTTAQLMELIQAGWIKADPPAKPKPEPEVITKSEPEPKPRGRRA